MTKLSMPMVDMTRVSLLTIAIKDNYGYVRYLALKDRFPKLMETTVTEDEYNQVKLLHLLEG